MNHQSRLGTNRRRWLAVAAAVSVLGLASCGEAQPADTSPTTASATNPTSTSTAPESTSPDSSTTTPPATPSSPAPLFTLTVPDAVSMNLDARPGNRAILAWTTAGSVRIATLSLDGQELLNEVVVSDASPPFAHPIERPAISIGADGSIAVAYTALGDGGGSVLLVSEIGIAPDVISGEPELETNLVHMTRDPADSLVLAWLEDSTLSVSSSVDDAMIELELVDDRTCDCCNPVPLFVGDDLMVAYRDLDEVGGEIVRDVAVVRSVDGGMMFADPLVVADDHWFINGCPFTGPSIVEHDGTTVVAWMDARQTVHPDQSSSSIWVDVSGDAGVTFGRDVEVTGDGINRWPVMAVDETGTIHLIWERQGSDGGLMYAVSDDSGSSFTDPVVLVPRAENGPPKTPSVAYHDGLLLVTWTDADGGRVGAWRIGG